MDLQFMVEEQLNDVLMMMLVLVILLGLRFIS